MKFLIGVLSFFLFGVAAGAVTPTADADEAKLFFEPTQADTDASWRDIQAQQEEYVKARKAGNYAEARRLALFHTVRAWSYHNEALNIITSQAGWCSTAELKRSLELWAEADAEIALAREGKSHVKGDQGADACSDKVARNKDLAVKQLEALEAGKKCK